MKRKQYDNVNRKNLKRVNKIREQLWELASLADDISNFGLMNDKKKTITLRNDLLNEIYAIESNLKIAIFDFENTHLA